MKFIHTDIDKTVLPQTKGKKVGNHRFYDIDGTNYPSVTSVLSMRKSEGLQKWRKSIGEDVANWEMRRCANRGKSLHTLVERSVPATAALAPTPSKPEPNWRRDIPFFSFSCPIGSPLLFQSSHFLAFYFLASPLCRQAISSSYANCSSQKTSYFKPTVANLLG